MTDYLGSRSHTIGGVNWVFQGEGQYNIVGVSSSRAMRLWAELTQPREFTRPSYSRVMIPEFIDRGGINLHTVYRYLRNCLIECSSGRCTRAQLDMIYDNGRGPRLAPTEDLFPTKFDRLWITWELGMRVTVELFGADPMKAVIFVDGITEEFIGACRNSCILTPR